MLRQGMNVTGALQALQTGAFSFPCVGGEQRSWGVLCQSSLVSTPAPSPVRGKREASNGRREAALRHLVEEFIEGEATGRVKSLPLRGGVF